MTTALQAAAETGAAGSVFARVVAGVDGSEPGYEAARQAARLVDPDGSLELFTAVYLVEANLAGWSSTRIRAELEAEAGEAARRAVEIAGPRAESRLVNGPPLTTLFNELKATQATLAVLGTHGHSRLSEMLLGGVSGELLHHGPCSICIARPPAADALFPRAIVAGFDGSAESEAALEAARELADRFGVPLRLVTAVGGKAVDRERAARIGAELVDGRPVDALVDAGTTADIVVVGNRGLHGLRALGSVSERVAHEASCSVLVVRRT